jgi:hypothetical protein
MAPSFVRNLLAIVLVVMLAACNGTQSVTNAMPQGASQAHRVSGKSWMLKEAQSENLLYVSSWPGNVYVFSYPALKEVGHLNAGGLGLCSDQNGDVFIPSLPDGYPVIYEYAHGGTSPIETLLVNDDDRPVACAIDPTTGNLAVANQDGYSCRSNVAIFSEAQGEPTVYCTQPAVGWVASCGYDDAGNLYVDGDTNFESWDLVFAELPRGAANFSSITLNDLKYPGSVQWDGSYITIETEKTPKIFEVQVSGSNAQIVHTTDFSDAKHAGLSWIQGDDVILPAGLPNDGATSRLGIWAYPSGGNAIHRISPHIGRELAGVTVSVAPQ